MPRSNTADPVVQAYAQAILDLAVDAGQAEAVAAELAELRSLVEANPDLALFLASPSIGVAEREALLQRVFEGKLSRLLLNFLGVVNAKGRLSLLRSMAQAYQELLDEKMGRVKAEVTVAVRLSDDDLEHVRQGLNKALKKDVQVQQKVDDSILGGLVVKVEDKLMDASVRAQLEAMRKQLLAAKVVSS